MKFDRILTSGCAVNVFEGKERLKGLLNLPQVEFRFSLSSGISPNNIKKIIEFIEPNALHFSGAKKQRRGKSKHFSAEALFVDEEKLKSLIHSSRR